MAERAEPVFDNPSSLLREWAQGQHAFEPWLFFPRGWDWPWLSFRESWQCVWAWSEQLRLVAPGGKRLLHVPSKVPEGLLLDLAAALVGWTVTPGPTPSRGLEGPKPGVGEPGPKEQLSFEFQGGPIRPALFVGPCHYGPGHAGPGHAGPGHAGPGHAGPGHYGPGAGALKRSHWDARNLDLRPENHTSDSRSVVLCTGAAPCLSIVESVLRAGAALALEPEPRYLGSALAVRPTILLLGEEDLAPLGRLVDEAVAKRKARRRLRINLGRLRLVVLLGSRSALDFLGPDGVLERLNVALAADGNPLDPEHVVLAGALLE